MAGRKSGFRHNQTTRDKIKAQQLINRLTKHVMAKSPILDASQVNAAKTLLNKVLPDLKGVEMTSTMEVRTVEQYTDAELIDIATGSGERTDQTSAIPTKPDSIH